MANFIKQVGKNIFSGWFSVAVRIFLIFLVNPFIIFTLGKDLYGVWVLVASIINYLTILDLGLKQALIRFVSKYLGLKEYDKINSILNSAFLIYSAVGLLTILISLLLSVFALDWLNIPAEYLSDARLALIIIGLNTALGFVLVWRGNSLESFHRYDIANILRIFEDICRTVAIVILLKNGYGLVPFAATFLVFNLLRLIVASGLQKRLYPFLRFSFGSLNRESFGKLFHYGIISFMISVGWLLMANTDNVIIGYFLTTESVALYAVAAGFIIYLRSFIQAASFPLRPMISHLDATDSHEKIVTIYLRGTKYLYFLSFLFAGGAFIYADSFFHLWLGEEFAQSAQILKILIFPAALFLPQSIANSIMFGLERHKYLLYLVVFEGAANLVLSLFLIKSYGLNGVAYGTIIPQLIIYLPIVPLLIRSILHIKLSEFYLNFLKAAFPAGVLSLGLSYILQRILPPNNWSIFFAEVALVGLITITAGLYILGKSDFMRFVSEFKKQR